MDSCGYGLARTMSTSGCYDDRLFSLLSFVDNLAADDGHDVARIQNFRLGNFHDVF